MSFALAKHSGGSAKRSEQKGACSFLKQAEEASADIPPPQPSKKPDGIYTVRLFTMVEPGFETTNAEHEGVRSKSLCSARRLSGANWFRRREIAGSRNVTESLHPYLAILTAL